MARRILFRGKPENTEIWGTDFVYGYYWTNELGNYFIRRVKNGGRSRFEIADIEVDENTVEQSVGVLDNNGCEIYEGDLVSVHTYDIDPETDGYGVVTWQPEEARFGINFIGLYIDFDNVYPNELEIEGNIIDNPDMAGVFRRRVKNGKKWEE